MIGQAKFAEHSLLVIIEIDGAHSNSMGAIICGVIVSPWYKACRIDEDNQCLVDIKVITYHHSLNKSGIIGMNGFVCNNFDFDSIYFKNSQGMHDFLSTRTV